MNLITILFNKDFSYFNLLYNDTLMVDKNFVVVNKYFFVMLNYLNVILVLVVRLEPFQHLFGETLNICHQLISFRHIKMQYILIVLDALLII